MVILYQCLVDLLKNTIYASSETRDQRELKVKSLITTVIQFLVANGQPKCASQFSVTTYRDRKLVSWSKDAIPAMW